MVEERKYILKVWQDPKGNWQASLKDQISKETEFFASFCLFVKYFSILQAPKYSEVTRVVKTNHDLSILMRQLFPTHNDFVAKNNLCQPCNNSCIGIKIL